jgi:hypothetical protein
MDLDQSADCCVSSDPSLVGRSASQEITWRPGSRPALTNAFLSPGRVTTISDSCVAGGIGPKSLVRVAAYTSIWIVSAIAGGDSLRVQFEVHLSRGSSQKPIAILETLPARRSMLPRLVWSQAIPPNLTSSASGTPHPSVSTRSRAVRPSRIRSPLCRQP